jgi:hypothetical protein
VVRNLAEGALVDVLQQEAALLLRVIEGGAEGLTWLEPVELVAAVATVLDELIERG